MKVTIVIRSPFIDKIPSLKNLVIFLAENGIKVSLINTYHPNYPICDFKNYNINVKTSPVRQKKLQLPTTIGLAKNVLLDILTDKANIYIGADVQACEILMRYKSIFHFRYWNFLLEYPDIDNPRDIDTLQRAEKIITHDKWHSNFLNQHCGTNDSQFLYLPNSTHTKEKHESSKFLHQRLNLDDSTNILLHSGGLGKWFLCQELANATKHLPENCILVFHTSHNTTGSDYFKSIKAEVETNNLPVKFSLKPVSDDELDTLVSSATIGLAFYSVEKLGYRAENMGVAAGKIGNYLKCGVPVICTKLPSLKYIEDFGCGVLIDSFDNLPSAIEKILTSYEVYQSNAYKCYNALWEPVQYLEKIVHTIRS